MTTNTLGPYLADCRRAAGLTQQQVADALAVTKSTVSGYERGRFAYGPRDDLLDAFAVLTGADRDELYVLARKIVPEVKTRLTHDLAFARRVRCLLDEMPPQSADDDVLDDGS